MIRLEVYGESGAMATVARQLDGPHSRPRSTATTVSATTSASVDESVPACASSATIWRHAVAPMVSAILGEGQLGEGQLGVSLLER